MLISTVEDGDDVPTSTSAMATTSSVTALFASSSSSSPLIRRASFSASLEHVNNWDVHNAGEFYAGARSGCTKDAETAEIISLIHGSL